jgi:hypothetical protein
MEYNLEAFKSDTLATQLLVADMSFTLSGGIFGNTPAGQNTILVLEPKVSAKREIIRCTISGATVTILERGIDGTTAVQHEINASVIAAFTPTHYTSIKEGAALALIDGWQDAAETWTYASGTTITVPAGNLLKRSVGDKVKCNQSIPLTAYFPLEDKDSDVGSFTVANVGTPTYTAGKFSNALTLNGTDQALAITDDALLKPTGAFTMAGWFKTANTGAVKMIFQSRAVPSSTQGINLYVNASNQLSTQTGNGTTSSTVSGSTVVTDNALHYVVVSYQSNHIKIFLDGVLEASGYAMTPTYAATNYVRIGCGNDSGSNNNWFNGQIDDFFFKNGFAVDQYWVAAKYAAATAQGTANITATYQGYVTAVTDTLLTVTGGADYALYNGTITSPYYSKSSSPVGFPSEGVSLGTNPVQTLTMDGRTATIKCSKSADSSVTTGGPQYGWYYSGDQTVTFGLAFSSFPSLAIATLSAHAIAQVTTQPSVSAFNWAAKCPSSVNSGANISWVAIGKI